MMLLCSWLSWGLFEMLQEVHWDRIPILRPPCSKSAQGYKGLLNKRSISFIDRLESPYLPFRKLQRHVLC